jgi:hypothetical protein
MHFLPGAVSSSLVIFTASIERMSPLLDSSFLTLCRSRFSNTVAAESGIVFLKNDLSKTCIPRLTGGKNSSGKFGEFIFKKFLDQVANLLVHRAMQIQTRILNTPKICAVKGLRAQNEDEDELLNPDEK